MPATMAKLGSTPVDMPRHKEKGDKSRNPLKDIAPITEIGKSAYGNA